MTLRTLKIIADALDVKVRELVNFAGTSTRLHCSVLNRPESYCVPVKRAPTRALSAHAGDIADGTSPGSPELPGSATTHGSAA